MPTDSSSRGNDDPSGGCYALTMLIGRRGIVFYRRSVSGQDNSSGPITEYGLLALTHIPLLVVVGKVVNTNCLEADLSVSSSRSDRRVRSAVCSSSLATTLELQPAIRQSALDVIVIHCLSDAL